MNSTINYTITKEVKINNINGYDFEDIIDIINNCYNSNLTTDANDLTKHFEKQDQAIKQIELIIQNNKHNKQQ